jgi:hypothetical protein
MEEVVIMIVPMHDPPIPSSWPWRHDCMPVGRGGTHLKGFSVMAVCTASRSSSCFRVSMMWLKNESMYRLRGSRPWHRRRATRACHLLVTSIITSMLIQAFKAHSSSIFREFTREGRRGAGATPRT